MDRCNERGTSQLLAGEVREIGEFIGASLGLPTGVVVWLAGVLHVSRYVQQKAHPIAWDWSCAAHSSVSNP
jgi:hypothetical protein